LEQQFLANGKEHDRVIAIWDTAGGATFSVKVQPHARKNKITGELGDMLELSVTAAPVDSKANDACIELVAKSLNVTRGSVTIASGQTSRKKLIRIAGMSAAELKKRLSLSLKENSDD
jgi:uncharacterized protein (TIGR00251 family)